MKTWQTRALCIGFILSSIACGKKDDDSEEPTTEGDTSAPPAAPVTGSAPATSSVAPSSPAPADPTKPPPPFAKIWVASNVSRTIAGYTEDGTRLYFVDLSVYFSAGGITSLTFLNKNTLIATADPGAAGERIVRIDLLGDGSVDINPGWFQDVTNFNNITMTKVVPLSSSKLAAVKGSAMIESLAYNLTSNIVTRTGAPWINTSAGCPLTVAQYNIGVTSGSQTKLLALSSGANSRLNVYGNLTSSPSCDSSYNFATAYPANPAYMPVGAAQLGNKIYVRYQHATTPVIARYDFDGTTLSNGTAVFQDVAYLNTDVVSRDLVALDDKTLLLGNWGTDSIIKWNTQTQDIQYFLHDAFTIDPTAIAIRPTE